MIKGIKDAIIIFFKDIKSMYYKYEKLLEKF